MPGAPSASRPAPVASPPAAQPAATPESAPAAPRGAIEVQPLQ
jgi:hypothetical protein